MSWKLIVLAALCCAAVAAPQGKKQQETKQPEGKRDLAIERIENEAAPPKIPNIPRSYAVIVGIGKYKNLPADKQLRYTVNDAQAIRTVLISPEGGNFKVENVHMLIDEAATLANVRREIGEWLPSVAKEGDRVLIYFAGHGFLYGGQGYLAPSDFKGDDVPGTGYPMRELGQAIGGKIHASYKILLTDACHTGAISPEDTQNLNQTLSKLNESVFSMTASRDREASLESETLRHGIFTYYVVQGLTGAADTNRDGIVTADELGEYVHTQVREATQAAQNPTYDKGSFDADMLLSYVPANVNPAAPPAPRYGTLIFETDKADVQVFVDGELKGTASKGQPLTLPGIPPGQHMVQGVHMGFEPDGPRPEMVAPGQESTVTLRFLIPRRRKQAVIDLLDKGVGYYTKGDESNYKKAVGYLEKALQEDPTYSQAAFYLGLTYNALFDQAKAREYFEKAIKIDPDYLEAHSAFAGMLLDIGSVDEALRHIDLVLRLRPKQGLAWTMQAQALRFKELYPDSIKSARRAIQLDPQNAEPHLWLADSLRLSDHCPEAKQEYGEYLKLSDFDSKLAGQLNYYVIGSLFGLGRRKKASQHDIWRDLRSLAYFGLCDCDKNKDPYLESAINYCTKSLAYNTSDPFAHFALGVAFMYRFNRDNKEADLHPAAVHFRKVIELNPELKEAQSAKANLLQVEKAIEQLKVQQTR
jgi:tetratricopeptide (TPR) repeat protein